MKKTINMYDELGWEKAEGYPVGTRIKTLQDKGGEKTIMLKLPQGFHMESHTHISNEQHFVLEGKYESEGTVYSAGTFRFIPAHKNHGPFTSETGAIILIIWNPVDSSK